jgi:hypothetical protein
LRKTSSTADFCKINIKIQKKKNGKKNQKIRLSARFDFIFTEKELLSVKDNQKKGIIQVKKESTKSLFSIKKFS